MAAHDWTRFRGPNGTGQSGGLNLPSTWSDRDIHWKIELPGKGHSSPVVWGERVFVTSADEKGPRLSLFCVGTADGQQIWRRDLDLQLYALHRFNTFASSTPAVDEERVYLAWLNGTQYQLIAFAHDGTRRWAHPLGAFTSQHGSGTSPIVHDGKVIVIKDPDGESLVVALHAKDGTVAWTSALSGSRADYGTPCLYTPAGGKPLLVLNSMEDGVLALDPQTGRQEWRVPKVFSLRCVSSPVVASGLIIGSCGSGGGGNYLAAVRPPDAAKGTPGEVAYTIRRSAPYVPTSVALGDWLFLWNDGGIVTCLEAPTGKIKWQERVGGNFFASPVRAGDRLFNVSTSGEVIVLAAADTFRELGRNRLGDGTHATPAISGGRMYLRTFSQLIALGKE